MNKEKSNTLNCPDKSTRTDRCIGNYWHYHNVWKTLTNDPNNEPKM